VSALFVVLGQAGTSVRGAYDVLVSMSVITYFIPFLFMFAALIRVQDTPPAAGVIQVPGGRPAAIVLASLGLTTTTIAIVLACVPSADDPNPALAVMKIVGLSVVMMHVNCYLEARSFARSPGRHRRPGLCGEWVRRSSLAT
jgi:amino acid transporter